MCKGRNLRGPGVGAMLTVISIVFVGCSTQAKWTYPFDPVEVVNPSPPTAKVAVLPAKDSRENTNQGGTWWLYMIPVLPFGWATYQRPEAATMFLSIASFDSSLYEDIPKAMAQHMQDSGYVKTAFFDYGGLTETADYVLSSDLKATTYNGTIISYGLSVYGPLLWLFGLPSGKSEVVLELDLSLKDRNGTVVWSDTLSDRGSYLQGLYYNMGRDMESLARILQKEFDRVLREHPLGSKSRS